MQARTRTLLAAALAAVLFAPAAFAQSSGKALNQPAPPPSAPVPASGVENATSPPPTTDDAWKDNQMQDTTKDDVVRDTTDTERNDAMDAKGATHAATHSAVATRATFGTLDTDHDGRISATEASSDSGFNFSGADSDADGFVSDAEYRTWAKANMDTSQGAEHAAAHSAVVTRDVFATLDADHDGRISAAEAGVDADFNGGFSAMDSNGDGYVTDAEYRAGAKAQKP